MTFKAYSLSEDGKFFGGIYFWQTEQDAKIWFNDVWFARTEKTYGTRGEVEYFKVVSTKCVAEALSGEGDFWSVVSFGEAVKIDETATGLMKIVEIKRADNQNGFVTLWHTKRDAQNYFDKRTAGEHRFFDLPLLLDNSKQ